MKKRLLSWILCLCIVVCMMPAVSLAAEVASGMCGDNVTWSLDSSGTLTISGTGDMDDYGPAAPPWWNVRDDVKQVVIESGVTSIGTSAFFLCESLRSITIPNSVTSIRFSAFGSCSSLTSVTIAEGLTSIGEGAFYECSSLASITIPNSVTSIESTAFEGCSSLTSITIPNSVTSIGNHAFYKTGYYNDASNWRDGILCCGNWVLNAQTDITDAKIPNSITGVAGGAFYHCSSLMSITIPNSVTRIGENTFQDCSSLTSITIPNSVSSIDRYAFYNCGGLTNLTIPESVTSIGKYAFGYVENERLAPVKQENFTAKVYGNSAAEAYCKEFGLSYELVSAPGTKFTDVDPNQYYAVPVAWAVENGITAGTSSTTFSPELTCTRGQIMTFLWKAAGSPEPKSSKNPFTDIDPSQYYYKPILWAVEHGITSGTSSTTFSPDQGCTRGQVMTFLWRNAGSPSVSASNPFTDVKPADYYSSAVLWAVSAKITAGTSPTTFSPDDTCTRGQIVTFLYRNME